MKIRNGFVTNSSSSSCVISGMNKLKALSLKELEELSKECSFPNAFMEDCLFLRGEGPEIMKSGDGSEFYISIGDKEIWNLSWGFWGGDGTASKALKSVGVKIEDGTLYYEIEEDCIRGRLSPLTALLWYGITKEEYNEIIKHFKERGVRGL